MNSTLKGKDYFDSIRFDYNNTRFTFEKNGDFKQIYEVGKYYKVERYDGIKFFKYIGVFDRIEDVPLENCLYVIGNMLLIREIDYDKLLKSTFFNDGMNQRNKSIKIDKNDPLLNTTINPDDNVLLVLLKMVMKHRKLTENGFKQLYPNTSEMNNMKRLIFHGNGSLSWPKFEDCLSRLNAEANIEVIDRETKDSLANSDSMK